VHHCEKGLRKTGWLPPINYPVKTKKKLQVLRETNQPNIGLVLLNEFFGYAYRFFHEINLKEGRNLKILFHKKSIFVINFAPLLS